MSLSSSLSLLLSDTEVWFQSEVGKNFSFTDQLQGHLEVHSSTRASTSTSSNPAPRADTPKIQTRIPQRLALCSENVIDHKVFQTEYFEHGEPVFYNSAIL